MCGPKSKGQVFGTDKDCLVWNHVINRPYPHDFLTIEKKGKKNIMYIPLKNRRFQNNNKKKKPFLPR